MAENPENASLSEKQKIELATASGFLTLYNIKQCDDYEIICHGDAPDIKCESSVGKLLNLEITLTQNRDGDIKWLLGRNKEYSSMPMCMNDVRYMIVNVIKKKFRNRYGAATALVVRDSSPIPWDWEHELDWISNELIDLSCPFDKGVWIIDTSKKRLWQVPIMVV